MPFRFPDARILIFAKAPVPGQVKTRLIPALGAQGAAALQAQLIERTVSHLVQAGLAPIELWCAPDTGHPLFQALAREHKMASLVLRSQLGEGLGERMASAARSALAEARWVVLVGCDLPELDGEYLQQALAWLVRTEASSTDGGKRAVLGPAEDGGYGLLGLSDFAPELFAAMPWGGAEVAEITRRRLEGLGWEWTELAPLWDLDRPEDLARWRGSE